MAMLPDADNPDLRQPRMQHSSNRLLHELLDLGAPEGSPSLQRARV